MSTFNVPKNLLINYLERRKVDYQNCKTAIINNDFEALMRITHQIKGNAASFGFDNLSNIAKELEKFALSKDVKNLNLTMNEFSKFLLNNEIK